MNEILKHLTKAGDLLIEAERELDKIPEKTTFETEFEKCLSKHRDLMKRHQSKKFELLRMVAVILCKIYGNGGVHVGESRYILRLPVDVYGSVMLRNDSGRAIMLDNIKGNEWLLRHDTYTKLIEDALVPMQVYLSGLPETLENMKVENREIKSLFAQLETMLKEVSFS